MASGCCGGCWQWFVELVLREELAEAELEAGGKEWSVPAASTSALTELDESYRRDRMKQLFNGHGYNLAMFPGGHVKGVREAFNLHAVIECLPSDAVGEVRIRGVETGLFLAMDSSGRLYGEEDPSNNNTVFVEKQHDHYLTYLSKAYAHLGWYVGIKKSGDAKNGRLTWYPWGQKAVFFVPRRAFAEHHPLKQLVNRHGFALVILDDGTVKGVREEFSKHSVLEFTPSSPVGAFRIRGVESDLYLAMDSKGRLYGEKDRQDENALFTEHSSQGRYFVYLSVRWCHLGWHVGIKRSGKAKKATKTVYPPQQKAIQFVHKIPYQRPPNELDLAALGETFPPLAFIDEDNSDE